MKILIADDDELSLDILEHMLRRAGYDVVTADNGWDALDIIQTQHVRLVITDWEMPGLNGPDLCQLVRHSDIDGYVYVILLSGHQESGLIVQGMKAGADDFVTKPFHAEELLVRIRAGERILALETREVAIFALAKLAESRDTETGQHLERVQHYSRALSTRLSINPKFSALVDFEFVRLVYLTSPLHDIGKVGVPDGVLRKPGRLTGAEFAIMKSHANIGAQTLEAALQKFPEARFLKMARDIAATHHERWNGLGYPAGLKGSEIPLAGRIVALADVYDALTSRRVYKAAIPHDQAKKMILEASGSHFDPDIVEAFIASEAEFVRILDRFQDQSEPVMEDVFLICDVPIIEASDVRHLLAN